MLRNTLFIFLLCFSTNISAVVSGGEIAVDSPRGNYEGADNIHWYQQQSLKEEDYKVGFYRSGDPAVCNESDISLSCFGHPIRRPMKMYRAQGAVPFNLAIWVDNRETDNFNFQWRRAIREVRRINATLLRSGVNLQVYISKIEYKDLSQFSGIAEEIYDYYNNTESEAYTYALNNQADAVMIIHNTEDLDIMDTCGWATIGPTETFLPIMVLTCVYEGVEQIAPYAPITAAHEFGHILGLDHNVADDRAFIAHGYGFYDAVGKTNTIMSQRNNARKYPVFSSPFAIWNETIQGNTQESNATNALNDTATTAATFYERTWGVLSDQNEISKSRSRVFLKGPPGVE